MHREITSAHVKAVEVLAAKGVDYNRLRGALTPSRGKHEVAFVLDSEAAGEYDYGTPALPDSRGLGTFAERNGHNPMP